jgi:hypothetical protein
VIALVNQEREKERERDSDVYRDIGGSANHHLIIIEKQKLKRERKYLLCFAPLSLSYFFSKLETKEKE